MSDKYKKRFLTILEQSADDELTPADVTPEAEQDALKASMQDSDVSADDFSVDPGLAGLRSKHLQRFKDIIEQFEEFAKYLNSEADDSVNSFLNAVDKDGSIFS